MIELQVESEEVLAALARLTRAASDLRGPLADIAQALASESERQFEKEEGPGGKWEDLSETTKAMRSARGKWPGKMLQVSAGGLAASVQTGFDRSAAWIGSNKPYAAMQQLGGTTAPNSMIPGRRIPARPYLPMDESGALSGAAERSVLDIVTAHLERARDRT